MTNNKLRRKKILQLRVNEAEYAAAVRSALEAGVPLSEWLRAVIRKKCGLATG